MGDLVVDEGILSTAGRGGSALPSTEDTQAQVWSLQDQLYRKASKLARHGHKMEYLFLSDADLEKLGNDERRITRLRMKLETVDELLAGGESSVPNPQTPVAP